MIRRKLSKQLVVLAALVPFTFYSEIALGETCSATKALASRFEIDQLREANGRRSVG